MKILFTYIRGFGDAHQHFSDQILARPFNERKKITLIILILFGTQKGVA